MSRFADYLFITREDDLVSYTANLSIIRFFQFLFYLETFLNLNIYHGVARAYVYSPLPGYLTGL